MAIKLSRYFLILLPVSLISGPLISEILMNLISIFFLSHTIKNKMIKFYFKNKIVLLIFIFYIVCIFSSLNSTELLFSLKTSIPYLRFLIFALAVSWIIFTDESILQKVFYSFLFCYTLLILFAFLEHFTGYNVIYGDQFRSDRLSSLFGDELILGSYLSRFFPILIGLGLFYIKLYSTNVRYLFYIIIVTTPLIVFLSGERTSFFFMIVGFSSSLLLLELNSRFKFGFLLSVVVLIFGFLYFGDNVKKNTFERTLKQIKPSNSKIHFFSDEHEALAVSAIKIFKDNKILGSGPKTFRKKCKETKYEVKNVNQIFGCYTHPHNTYLQILAETGIFGFLIIFILLILIIYNLFKIFIQRLFYTKIKSSSIEIASYLSFLISLFPVVPGANFFNNYINIIYYIPLGIFLYLQLKKKSNYNEKII